MARKKDVKKDINNLCHEVIDECIIFLEHTPTLNQENVYQIISDTVEMRNDLIFRINNHENNSTDHRPKHFYRNIKRALYDHTVNMLDRLNSLPR